MEMLEHHIPLFSWLKQDLAKSILERTSSSGMNLWAKLEEELHDIHWTA